MKKALASSYTESEGVASQQGKVSFCISCHTGAKAKDYLFGFE